MPLYHSRPKIVRKLPFKLQGEKIQIASKFQDHYIYRVYSLQKSTLAPMEEKKRASDGNITYVNCSLIFALKSLRQCHDNVSKHPILHSCIWNIFKACTSDSQVLNKTVFV